MSFVSRHRILVGLAVGLPVSAFFLWLAFRDAHPEAVWRALTEATPGLVALTVLAMAGVYGFQSVRWRRVAATPQVRLARFYEMVVTGVACNNVLPARLGDILRARWLSVDARMPGGRAFGTVVLDRGCDLVALFALLLVGLASVAEAAWLVRIAVGAALILVVLGVVLVFSRAYTGRRVRERRERGVLRTVARDTAELLAEPIGRRRLAVWLALSLGAWTTWSIGAMLIARSLGFELSLVEALFVAAVMNLGVAIPSSPGFVGTYEWLGVASLGLLGVPAEQALAFALLIHASWFVPTTLAGGAALGARALARVHRVRMATEPVD